MKVTHFSGSKQSGQFLGCPLKSHIPPFRSACHPRQSPCSSSGWQPLGLMLSVERDHVSAGHPDPCTFDSAWHTVGAHEAGVEVEV